MKYTDAEYIDAMEFDDRDVDLRARTKKIVTTRKEHPCCMGDLTLRPHQIPPKSKAVRESAILEDDGWSTCYACLPCLEKWLDHINGENDNYPDDPEEKPDVPIN